MSLNCWEYLKCEKHETCPAGHFDAADGFLGGKNGGKACVYITGTFCNRSIQGTFKDKEKNCGNCEYYKYLKHEHGNSLSVFHFSDHIREHDPELIGKYFKKD